ncbi:MAG: nuclear transport factor 2 family protein [Pseudomonadota bacterium]
MSSVAFANSPDSDLFDQIMEQDQAMFGAFNSCDKALFETFIAEDVEFYHDNDGIVERASFIDAVETSICNNFTRSLIKESMEVWPVTGFGAIQTGRHLFTNSGASEPHGEAKFLQIWKQEDGQWKVTRIVSYAHGPFVPMVEE